jgi:hypothetical protein
LFVETSSGGLKFQDFKNIFAPGSEGYVKVTCEGYDAAGSPDPENGIYEWSETSDVQGRNLFADASKTKGFLDYKHSLAVYLQPKDAKRIDLFDLLMRGLLSQYENPVSRLSFGYELGVMERRVKAYWFRGNLTTLESHLRDFNAGLSAVLTELNVKASEILAEFQTGVSIRLVPARVWYGRPPKRLTRMHVALVMQYYGRRINQPHLFLNEARLSAIAISIFLGSVLIQPASKLRLLILDDMLIGLDFSNRMPLLKALKTAFKDYQILLLTFDRHWFEIAKEELTAGWTACEMYVCEHKEGLGGVEVLKGNKPQLVQPSDSYFFKGKKYFDLYDYPAAANYLRKECERLIDSLLPLSYKIESEGQFGSREITRLETLIDKLGRLFKDCDEPIPTPLEHQLQLYKKAVLNPMSHHDLESPIYRSEVEQLFGLVNELAKLPQLKRQICLKAGSPLTYELNDTGCQYKIEIELAEDLYTITVDGTSRFNNARWKVNTWTLNGVEHSNMNPGDNRAVEGEKIETTCKQLRTFDEIVNGVFGPHGLNIAPPPDAFAEFKVLAGRSLRDMLSDV